MKKDISLVAFFVLLLSACKKSGDDSGPIPVDSGCIEWKKTTVTDHSAHSLNPTNIPIITGVFSSNSIDYSTYRYYYYSQDSVQTQFPPFAKFDQKIIRVSEFTNRLEIFKNQLLFNFRNNVLSTRTGNPTHGTSLDTIPHLVPGQIRSLFLGHIQRFDHEGKLYRDSCFCAEFGYYNLNVGNNNIPENLVKAWKVTLKNRIYPSEYPIAYYQDADGKLIVYDNGIQTFY